MAARREDEMEDETSDQTGQNSAGQVSYSENKVHAFCYFKEKSSPYPPTLNCQAKLQNGCVVRLLYNCKTKYHVLF